MSGCLWIVIVFAFTRTCVSNQDVFQEASGEAFSFVYTVAGSLNNVLKLSALKIDMTAVPATASLYPDKAVSSKASGAIDGNTQIGQSGATGWRKCASTKPNGKFAKLRYLKIDLGKLYYISAIRLHLRDDHITFSRQSWQNGLTVELINSSSAVNGAQCGDTYNAARHGQSPSFSCYNTATGILITLRQKHGPLQICEVEAFGGLHSEYWYMSIYECQ